MDLRNLKVTVHRPTQTPVPCSSPFSPRPPSSLAVHLPTGQPEPAQLQPRRNQSYHLGATRWALLLTSQWKPEAQPGVSAEPWLVSTGGGYPETLSGPTFGSGNRRLCLLRPCTFPPLPPHRGLEGEPVSPIRYPSLISIPRASQPHMGGTSMPSYHSSGEYCSHRGQGG